LPLRSRPGILRGVTQPEPDYPYAKRIPYQPGSAYIITNFDMSVKKKQKEEEILDLTLRPKNWGEFIGQKKLKRNIEIMIEAAKRRNEPPDHLLFYGGPGLGKSTLSYLIAKEIGKELKTTSGPAIERPGDLAAILTNLSEGEILFIDEIHRLNRTCEELLYPAMERFRLDIIIGKGPMAKTLELELPRFTLIGATTRIALLSSPLRSRFGAVFHLGFYNQGEIKQIIKRSAEILKIEIEEKAAEFIARRSRFTPRVANRLLKRVRDFAQVEGEGQITEEITKKGLKALEIDELGLEPQDRRILETIIEKFNGGPVGLKTLSASVSDEEDNILEIYEPYLIQLGLIKRTPKGRLATELAYKHLKIQPKNQRALI
jgi:Holliday junction DNA helicase RuvB